MGRLMSRLIILLMFCNLGYSQGFMRMMQTTSAPSGGCLSSFMAVDITVGRAYFCNNGTWAPLGGEYLTFAAPLVKTGLDITCPTCGGGGGVPSGMLTFLLSGTCPIGWTENTSLNGKTLFGTLAAGMDVGTTGGNDNITPTGTNSTPTFSGDSVSSNLVSGGTPSGTNGTVLFTPIGTNIAVSAGTPTGTNSTSTVTPIGTNATSTVVPLGTNSTSTVTPLGTNSTSTAAAQVFAGNSSTVIVNHVHVQNFPNTFTGGQAYMATDTSTTGSTASAISTANPTGGFCILYSSRN